MITYIADKKIWILETANTAYVFGLTPTGQLVNIYYGSKLPFHTDYSHAIDQSSCASFISDHGRNREEFAGWCMIKHTEPCLKVQFPEKVRDVRLVYEQCSTIDNTLAILLKDEYFNLQVTIYYTVHDTYDLIVRYAAVTNGLTTPVIIEQLLSGSVYLPYSTEYFYTFVTGKWCGETQLKKGIVPEAKVRIESRLGTTSHQTNPWFALEPGVPATENTGRVYFGSLAYSGNWNIIIEKDTFNQVKASAGLNSFDFQWQLNPGEVFTSPEFVIGFSDQGFGKASRNLHDYQLACVLPLNHRHAIRKVLYNSWEARMFNVNETDQIALASQAAELGIEIFVMDDGWFGQRKDDKAGLGDWYVNKEKFPNGLTPLIAAVNELGMDFGLWVEPEMVNLDSDLYRAHPDWVYHFPHRSCTERRNQLILNLSRSEVQEFILGFMDELLTNNNIRFIKWDMNRSFSEPGAINLPETQQKELWHRHVQAFYNIVDTLRAKHPQVVFQSCSGGGGRIDLGVFSRFDQAWTSDNTDAFDRLRIQHGFSFIYPAKVMEAWVTDETNWLNKRKLPLRYRFHSAMMGNLGIGDDITRWDTDHKAEAKQLIAEYKTIRETIQHGHQYRIETANRNIHAVAFVNRDKTQAVLFAFLSINQFKDDIYAIPVDGLDDQTQYRVLSSDAVLSGKALREMGLKVNFEHDFDSVLIKLEKA